MKNRIGRFLCLLIAAAITLGFTACGGEKQPDDPNLVKIDGYTVLYKGASIMVDDEGSDAVVLTLDYTNNSKKDAPFWAAVFEKAMQGGVQMDTALVYPDPNSFVSITDDKFADVAPGTTFEVHTSFVLRDPTSPVEVTFSDLFGKYSGTITIDPTTLPRAESRTASSTGETTDYQPTGDALLDWWNGDWYGWWIVTGGSGEYAGWSNLRWDCCANIRIGDDYTGSVVLWDEDLPRENAIAEATVTLNPAGTSEYGTLFSEDGYFMDGKLAHADWIVDPGIMNYGELISIDGWYEDDQGSFKYTTYLRPWGTIWDDVAANDAGDLPYAYEGWYLPLAEAGKPMPQVLGGTPDPSGEEPAETAAPEPENDEYGKSNPDAAGLATLEDMQKLYKICYESRTDGYHTFTYEQARDMLGSDGTVWKRSDISWNETKHTYRWVTEDGSDYFNISLELEDGEEWYYSCNFSDNVKGDLW